MVGDAGVARCLAATGVFGYRGSLVSVGLRRHYMLLGVDTGWPRLGFPVGSVFGVSLS